MRTELCKLEKILLPVDMSESSGRAAALVSGIARQFKSTVVVLFALEPVDHPIELLGGGMLETRSRTEVARAELQEFLKSLKLDFTYDFRVEEGRPAEVVTSVAEEIDADLICMSTRGRGRFRSFLLGSTTAKVLNDAQVPVLTEAHLERSPDKHPLKLRTVVCAIDLDERSRTALKAAILLARHFDARLLVVHAIETDAPERRENLQKMIDESASSSGIATEVVVARAAPAALVSATASERGVDLVVIGRSAPGPLGRLRTQSYAIVRSSPCPVLSV